MDAPEVVKDAALSEWVAKRRGWTYEIEAGYHVVRDPHRVLQARNADPALALEILERR